MTLAKRIRDCRYTKGWGPDELASRAEISRTALYQIESGKTEVPRAATLRKVAQALGVSVDVLLGDADRGPKDPNPMPTRPPLSGREADLARKFLDLLASPLGEGLARIVEESHQILPTVRLGGLAVAEEESWGFSENRSMVR